MRFFAAAVPLFVIIFLSAPSFAVEQKPDVVVDKMVVKLVRGVTNVGTSVLELPKQTYRSIRDRGPTGIAIGPLKGVVMTFYRALMGTGEAVFFMVPAPGYYDPMMDPEYVWQDWGSAKVGNIADMEMNPDAEPAPEASGAENAPSQEPAQENVTPPPQDPAATEANLPSTFQ